MGFRYYVFYVSDATPKLKAFESFMQRNNWVQDFLFSTQNDPDQWIDLVFDGEVSYNGIETKQIEVGDET